MKQSEPATVFSLGPLLRSNDRSLVQGFSIDLTVHVSVDNGTVHSQTDRIRSES